MQEYILSFGFFYAAEISISWWTEIYWMPQVTPRCTDDLTMCLIKAFEVSNPHENLFGWQQEDASIAKLC